MDTVSKIQSAARVFDGSGADAVKAAFESTSYNAPAAWRIVSVRGISELKVCSYTFMAKQLGIKDGERFIAGPVIKGEFMPEPYIMNKGEAVSVENLWARMFGAWVSENSGKYAKMGLSQLKKAMLSEPSEYGQEWLKRRILYKGG